MTPTTILATDGLRHRRTPPDRLDALAIGVIGCGVTVRIAFVALAPIASVVYRINDDAYYYFKVAQHIVAGQGPTFDGLNMTNGFHPLWMCCILPLFHVTTGSPDDSLRFVSCLLALLAGGSFVLCWLYVKNCAGRLASVLGVIVLLNPFMFNHLLNGLETGLLVFLMFLALWADKRYTLSQPDASGLKKAILGVLLALICLCRLDTAFLIIAFLLLSAVFYGTRPRRFCTIDALLRMYWPTLATATILLSPYFAWNLHFFRHLMPISGALKSSFPYPSLHLSPTQIQWLPYAAFLVVAICWIVLSCCRRTGYLRSQALPEWRSRRCVPLLASFWLASVLHFIYLVLFMKWAAHWWHFASHVPVIAVLFAAGCAALVRRARRTRLAAASIVVVSTLILASSTFVDRSIRGVHHYPWIAAALWVRNNTPRSAVFAMTDCGLFGYFSQRQTINLDGVINGYRYQAALADRHLPMYLSECGITHVADYEVRADNRGTHRIHLPARLANTPGYVILLPRAAQEYASSPYQLRRLRSQGAIAMEFHFVVWNYVGASLLER